MSNVHTPSNASEAASIINEARRAGDPLHFIGTRGTQVPDSHDGQVLSSECCTGIVDYRPGDLTVMVRAGTTVAELEEVIGDHRHTAVLPETATDRTIGGVVASGSSGFRRLRYGPTGDRVLGVTLVTGYGEVVHAGSQLVKNVTGYDLPRLVTGSHGALGFIAEVALKLWPVAPVQATVEVDDAGSWRSFYKLVAALETEQGARLYVEGDRASVDSQAAAMGGRVVDGFEWPTPLSTPIAATLNVPPRLVPEAVQRVRACGADRFTAQHGVGAVEIGWADVDAGTVTGLRTWAESVGGSLVLTRRGPLDPAVPRWGSIPSTISIQRRLKSLFDPDSVCNPGSLPGGL